MRKKLSSIVASITIASIILNHIQSIPVLQNAEAASFRTTYTVFGDLNDDKVIDSFDHFTVTAVIEDKTKEENNEYDAVMYQISSWGEKYYVSELEIGKYVSNKTTFTSPIISVSSNVLYLEESK